MKQKILFVITKSTWGGAQRYVYDIATALPKETYEIVVACGGTGALTKKLTEVGIRTVQIHSFQRDISIRKEFSALHELKQLYTKERPDIIHLNSSKAGMLGALAARTCGIGRVVFTAHGWPFKEQRSFLWRALAWIGSFATVLLCHRVIVVSQNDLQTAPLRQGVVCIHNGIETNTQTLEAKTPFALPADGVPTIVSIGELHPNKNHISAIQACAILKAQELSFQYHVFGDGEEQNRLQQAVRKAGLEQRVFFHGHNEHAAQYLSMFDIFLFPSKKEGLPYALLEAGVAGMPVIASNTGGIPEIIDDGKNGLLIDHNDPLDIAKAIQKLIDAPDLRMQFGTALQQKIQSSFKLSSMLSATIAVYTATPQE